MIVLLFGQADNDDLNPDINDSNALFMTVMTTTMMTIIFSFDPG